MQFAVIGLGKFGSTVARHLESNNAEVLALDVDEKIVQTISSEVNHVICADSTDEKSLKALISSDFDAAIISIGQDFEASILTLITLKEIGVKKIIVKALSETQAKILKRLGADEVIFPEIEMGQKLAHSLVNPDLLDFLNLSEKYSIAEINPPKDVLKKTIKDSAIRNLYDINIIAIRKRQSGQDSIAINPSPDRVINESDRLIVLGDTDKIRKMI